MDRALLVALNGLRAPWIDAVLGPLSAYGIFAFPLLMLLALFLTRDRWDAARSIRDGWLAWFLATFVTETVLKPIVARPRPTADEALRASLEILGATPGATSLSFPSGTATAAFAGGTWIALRWGWRPGVPALSLAALVSLSRVYAGVHWPTDVFAGALVGVIVAIVVDRVARRIEPRPTR